MMGKLSSTKEKYQAAQMRKEPTRRRVPVFSYSKIIWGCIQKFQDWPPGAKTANGTGLCH